MYGFKRKTALPFERAKRAVCDSLAEQGFGVLTEIDVQGVMKKKLDVERRPYTILGACNPQLAHRALEQDPEIGLLLPCNVVVREEDDGSTSVSFMDPVSVLGLVDQPGIGELATEVRRRLEAVAEALPG